MNIIDFPVNWLSSLKVWTAPVAQRPDSVVAKHCEFSDLSECKELNVGDHPCNKRFDLKSVNFGIKVPAGQVVTLYEGCFEDTT